MDSYKILLLWNIRKTNVTGQLAVSYTSPTLDREIHCKSIFLDYLIGLLASLDNAHCQSKS